MRRAEHKTRGERKAEERKGEEKKREEFTVCVTWSKDKILEV